jgi:hypothetical protein
MSTAGSTCAVCSALALLLARSAGAGIFVECSLDQLAKADVLAIGRVEAVTRDAAVARRVGDRVAIYSCTADLAVLRSLGEISGRVHVRYECYADHGPGVSGYPILPVLERGQTLVFPLKRAGAEWGIAVSDCVGALMPALPEAANLSRQGKAYLIDELANTFLFGTYRQKVAAGAYLGTKHWDDTHKLLFERMQAELKRGDPRWLDIGTAALASMGIPRQPMEYSKAFAALALMQLPEAARREGIVRNMLRYSDVHGWGSAATLVPEFKDDPLLLRLLPAYLEKDQPGALNIAWSLVRNGQTTLLARTLDAALRVLNAPNTMDVNDIYAASQVLVKYGSDSQFARFLEALERAAHDTTRYMQLWQVAYGEEGPRILRMIAVLLADERPMAATTTMRYCDIAGGRLQMIAKEDFGFKQWDQALTERNTALLRARAWLRRSKL